MNSFRAVSPAPSMNPLLCLKQQSNAYKCSDVPGIANVHFTFSSVFAIIMLHRVAFLRKSSCRSATLFLFLFKLKEGGK